MQTSKSMRKSAFVKIGLLSLALCVGATVLEITKAHAFDPKKVFKDDKPTHKRLFRHYFKKKRAGQNDEAYSVLKYAADQGSQTAMWKLGRMHEFGDGVKQSPKDAFLFYKQIADRYGDVVPNSPEWRITGKAMVALGHYYQEGIATAGIPVDREEARVMYTTSAMYFRDPDGQFELGKLLLNESSDPHEARQGIRMLNLSRKKGHPGALALLGQALVQGEYVQQDTVRGLTMLTRALRRSPKHMRGWVQELQQEAFSIASEEERNLAISALKN